MFVYESTAWFSTGSCLYVIFVPLVSVFVSCTHQLVVLCRPMTCRRHHLSSHLELLPHFPRAAAAGEGSSSATAAGFDVAYGQYEGGRLGSLLASTTSSELRHNHGGGGDGYIPTGELLGLPHSSSTHTGTVTPSRLAIHATISFCMVVIC
jgi:hypothetical protein